VRDVRGQEGWFLGCRGYAGVTVKGFQQGDYGCGVYGEYYEHCDGGEIVLDGLILDGLYLFLGCFPGFFKNQDFFLLPHIRAEMYDI